MPYVRGTWFCWNILNSCGFTMIFCCAAERTGTETWRPLFMTGRLRTTGLSVGRSCLPRSLLRLQKIKWKPTLIQNVCIRTMCPSLSDIDCLQPGGWLSKWSIYRGAFSNPMGAGKLVSWVYPILGHALFNFDGVKIACLAGTPHLQTCFSQFRWSENSLSGGNAPSSDMLC